MQTDAERAHEVLVGIRRIVRRVSEYSKRLSKDMGITVPQLLCLKSIGELNELNQAVTTAKLAEAVNLAVPTVSRIIDRLEAADWVRRERDPTDRRRVCLSLTPTGQERFQSLPTPLQESFVTRLNQLPQAEQEMLLVALERIAHLMDASELDAAPILVSTPTMRPDSA